MGLRAAPRDFRLVPIAVAAWAAVWVQTANGSAIDSWAEGAPLGVTLVVGVAGLVIGGVRRVPLVQAAAVTLLVVTAVAGARQHQLVTSPVARLAADHALVDIEFAVTGDPRASPRKRFGAQTVTAVVEVRRIAGRGEAYRQRQQVLLLGSGPSGAALRELEVGTSARASVRLAPSESGPSAALASLRSPPTVTNPPGTGHRVVEAVRAGLRAAVADLPEGQRALIPALVLGDTSLQTPELVEQFQATGLTHLTAVSGANLTLMLAFLLMAARWVGIRGWWLHGVGVGGVVIFVALCRTEPSVLRASAMGLVALAALGGHAAAGKGARHLCVAVIGLLLIDPWLGRSVGFALSVLASAGIIGFAAMWRDRMGWLPRPLAEAATVPLAAQLATQPLVTAVSGQISMVGLIANALAGPFVGPATVLGFVTAGLGVVAPPVASFTGWLAGWCAQAILWIACAGAGLPGASWSWPVTPAGLAVVGAGCLLGLVWGGRVLASRWLTSAVLLVMLIGTMRPQVVPGWPPGQWRVVACDVGQGTAVVLRAGEGQAVVVDAGPDRALLESCLAHLGVRGVPLLVLTHYHADHIDGRAAVVGRLPVGMLMVSPLASPRGLAQGIAAEAARAGVPVVEGRPGQRLRVGEVWWETVGPVSVPTGVQAHGDGESAAENDASIVAKVEVAGLRVLVTGDVEPAGQRAVLRSGVDLRADVLVVPHHGSGRQDEGFITATGASVALVSAGVDNDYGHPAPRTVRLLETRGQQVLRTDRQGSLAVAGSRDAMTMTTQK